MIENEEAQIGGALSIIDNGTSFIKSGFKRDLNPHQTPSIVGIPTDRARMQIDCKNIYFGDEARKMNKQAGLLDIKHPIHSSYITDWENME